MTKNGDECRLLRQEMRSLGVVVDVVQRNMSRLRNVQMTVLDQWHDGTDDERRRARDTVDLADALERKLQHVQSIFGAIEDLEEDGPQTDEAQV